MKKVFKKLWGSIVAHKIRSGLLILIVFGGGYFVHGKLFPTVEPTKYVFAAVERGDVIVSVTGSGQVSSSDEITIKPKTSGDITWIGIKNGQEVKTGETLFSTDSTDMRKSIADAEVSLEEARLNLEKSTQQAPIDYQKKLRSLENAKEDLSKEYVNTSNAISDAYLKMPAIMTNLENILYGTDIGKSTGQWNVSTYKDLFSREVNRDTVSSFSDVAEKEYKDARALYDAAFAKFKTFTKDSSEADTETFLEETMEMADAVARAAKSEKNLIDTVDDIAEQEKVTLNSYITTAQTNLNANITSMNSTVSALISQKAALKNAKDSVLDIEHDIAILEINNPTGGNPIDLQVQKNNIKKQESDLADLRKKLVDYTVYAPFSGIITTVDVKKDDSVSTGTSLATLITKQKIAKISLNEVDAAKVKLGQKAMLSFDAVDGLSAAGEVIEIDTVGTVSQGVVTYNVKIGLDSSDDGIKSGMSVSASIITDIRQNVVMVPNGAIKTQNNLNYVEIANGVSNATTTSQGVVLQSLPEARAVEVGLSNDSMTEIVSGVTEGEYVVTKTILSTTGTQTTAPSLLQSVGGARATGNTRSTGGIQIPR